MDCNGLSLYNVPSRLELVPLTQSKSGNSDDHEDESDDGEEQDEIQQRNAELENLIYNGFDDINVEDSSDVSTQQQSKYEDDAIYDREVECPLEPDSSGTKVQQDSLYSPLHSKSGNLSETQYIHGVAQINSNDYLPYESQHIHKENYAHFSSTEDRVIEPYRSHWKERHEDENENHYISSGLNSRRELEILYEACLTENSALKSDIHNLQHRVALLEGEKSGMKVTMETKDSILQKAHTDNQLLNKEIEGLRQQLSCSTDLNKESTKKLQAAENTIMNLERQMFDLNLALANYKDSNKQETLLAGIKAKYENDLTSLRTELTRLRNELNSKNENITVMERKLRDVTEMHERTLTEKASIILEFDRALNQQRALREQCGTLTSAALLDQLSKAHEEIERLKSNHLYQNMSDSMTQLQLGSNRDQREAKQSDLIIRNLEQRLQTSEKTVLQLEEKLAQLQQEKEKFSSNVENESLISSRTLTNPANEKDELINELTDVKELYLAVCREKDSLEDQISKLKSELVQIGTHNYNLKKDLENVHKNMEDNLRNRRASLEESFNSKLHTAVQEQLALMRPKSPLVKNRDNSELIHTEIKNKDELEFLRLSMDTLRKEKDALQNELINRQEQLRVERQILREKFEVEKQMLIKKWQEKVSSSLSASNKSGSQSTDNALLSATADAMARLRQHCEEEKLSIITGYEKQILELQSKSSTLSSSKLTPSKSQVGLDWKTDITRLKTSLKNSQLANLLPILDSAILKIENILRSDEKNIQDQIEKYKHLKRRVREYQKYVNDKLAKHKSERQQSEEYCRLVISDLLGRVTKELQLLEQNRLTINNNCEGTSLKLPSDSTSTFAAAPVQKPFVSSSREQAEGDLRPPPSLTFAEGIDNLQQQVNMYIRGLTNFNISNK